MYARLRCGGNLPLCLAFGTGVLGVLWWLGGWVVGWLAFGTGEGHLWYGRCVPCSKRLPGVRDAFSEAFGVKNRLLRYGKGIRCMKTPSCRTGRIFSARNSPRSLCSLRPLPPFPSSR